MWSAPKSGHFAPGSKILISWRARHIALGTRGLWSLGEDGGQSSEPHHILEPESVGLDPPSPHPRGLGQAQPKPSFDLSFILSSVPKITNMLVLLSPCPFELLSCCSGCKAWNRFSAAKGHHEMCISDELPEERINSQTWDGKVCWGRHHVTECASRQNRPSNQGLLNQVLAASPRSDVISGLLAFWVWGQSAGV